MVFPQEVTSNTIQITVTYNTTSESDKTKSAYLPTLTWEAGKSYLYKFKIQPSGPIIFGNTIEVTDWDNEEKTLPSFDAV